MGTINAKVDPRPEQEKYDADFDSGCKENAGIQGQKLRDKYVGIGGKGCPERIFIGDGQSVNGKIIRQLIDEYTRQVAQKHEQKKQIEIEIVELASRIQEFNILLEEVENKRD